ncbi:hypothetical protein EIZ25_13600 [Escherichia coli]|nr:hypothetical protein [Escherichia coli]
MASFRQKFCVNCEYRRFLLVAKIVSKGGYFSLSQVNVAAFRSTILPLIVHTVRFFVGQGLSTHFIFQRKTSL